jgi:hypothetical protein
MVVMKKFPTCVIVVLIYLCDCTYVLNEIKNTPNPPPSGTVLKTYPNGKASKILLKENWTGPRHQLCAAGTIGEYFDGSELKNCILAEDWLSPDSCRAKAGTAVEFYKNGNIRSFILAEDRTVPGLGSTLKEGTTVYYHYNGKLEKYTLATNQILRWGQILGANTDVEYYENGIIKQYTLADNWTNSLVNYFKPGNHPQSVYWPADAVFKKGTIVQNYKSTSIRSKGIRYPGLFNGTDIMSLCKSIKVNKAQAPARPACLASVRFFKACQRLSAYILAISANRISSVVKALLCSILSTKLLCCKCDIHDVISRFVKRYIACMKIIFRIAFIASQNVISHERILTIVK